MTKRRRWGGHQSRKARGAWTARVAVGVPCCRCGHPVLPRPWMPHNGWEPDHYPVPRHLGGTETWPAHSPECNQSAGGRDGARITNARKAEQRQIQAKPGPVTAYTERARGIRGV